MPKYISNNLCRLIRERAYSSGTLALLDQEEAELENIFVQQRQRYREIRSAKKKLVTQLANLDAEITRQLPVDPEDIRSIRNTPRFGSKHGSIVRSIVRMLTAQPAPVRTTDMVHALVQELGWPYATNEDREVARKNVVQPLRVLVKKGAVVRLHDTTKNGVGAWMWVGL